MAVTMRQPGSDISLHSHAVNLLGRLAFVGDSYPYQIG